jgi:hypothetical protein
MKQYLHLAFLIFGIIFTLMVMFSPFYFVWIRGNPWYLFLFIVTIPVGSVIANIGLKLAELFER